MYLGSTAVCCDEAMKLVTCFCILAFTYLRKKGSLGTGGEYRQLSTGVDEETEADTGITDAGQSDVADEEKDVDADITEANKYESFRSYLSEELQFDFRMAGIAGIYTVQKNLLYLGISNLDAAVFQGQFGYKHLLFCMFPTNLLDTNLFGLVLLSSK